MYKVVIFTNANANSDDIKMKEKILEFTAEFSGEEEYAKKCANEFLENFLKNYNAKCWGHINQIKGNEIKHFCKK